MVRRSVGFVLALLPSLALPFPLSVDIGTFAIDNYAGNGGGMPNLTYQIAAGQSFFSAANSYVRGYSGYFAGGTRAPSLSVDRRDTQVSKAAITSKSTWSSQREYCDFIFYGGHGVPGMMFLGFGAGFGSVLPADMAMGGNGSLGYNRWFFGGSCHLFNVGSPAVTWSGAFKGLKAMLGFESVVFDNNQSWHLYSEFWYNWTWQEKRLMDAFFDAQAGYGYAHLYPSAGLKPGCLSAKAPAGRTDDYCEESFRAIEGNYAAAASQTGDYYYRVIGNPIY